MILTKTKLVLQVVVSRETDTNDHDDELGDNGNG